MSRALLGVLLACTLAGVACKKAEQQSLVVVALTVTGGTLPRDTAVSVSASWAGGSTTKTFSLKTDLGATALTLGLYLPEAARGDLALEAKAARGGCNHRGTASTTINAGGATAPVPIALTGSGTCGSGTPDAGNPDVAGSGGTAGGTGGTGGAAQGGSGGAAVDVAPEAATETGAETGGGDDPPVIATACKKLVHHAMPFTCDDPLVFTVNNLAFRPDGAQLATASNNGVVLWDLSPAGQLTVARRLPTTKIIGLAYSHDGKWVAYGGVGLKLLVEPIAGGDAVALDRPSSGAYTLMFASDNDRIVSGESGTKVEIVSIAQRKSLAALEFPEYYSSFVGNGGRHVALLTRDNKVTFLDLDAPVLAAGPKVQVPVVKADADVAIALSADGKTLASASDAGIFLWDVTDKAAPKPQAQPVAMPAGEVATLAFSPSGRHLVVGTGDLATGDQLLLYSLATRQRVGEALRLDHYPRRVAFSPDGRAIAVALNGCGQFLYCR